MEALLLIDRIKTAIELGESHFREFKSCFEGKFGAKTKRSPHEVSIDIGKTLVAFANSDGGELYIGVEDDGTITGHSYNEDSVATLLNAPKSQIKSETPLKDFNAKRILINEIEILYFHVDKSTEFIHQTSDGRILVRDDKKSIPKDIEKIVFERQEQMSLQCDRQFIDGASMSDLDQDLIKYVSSSIANGISDEKCLQFLDLAEFTTVGLKIRRAALLLFAKDINKWHSRCGIRISRIIGNELKSGLDYNVKDDIIISDNILKLTNGSWERLRPHLAVHKYFSDGRFRESIIYPEEACREALINAIVHRDYSIEGRLIEIFVYDDKMEIKSPGGLLSHIRIDDLLKLKGIHQSRNSKISRVLRETGYMKEMGEGMRRIFHLMQGNELKQPEIYTDYSTFSIVLNNKSVYNEEDRLLLESYKEYNPSSEERLILLLGKNNKTLNVKQINNHLGLKNWETTNLFVHKLITKGLLVKIDNNKYNNYRKFIIRKASETDLHLIDLKNTLRNTSPKPTIENEFIKNVKDNLKPNNIYKKGNLLNLLKYLGFIDEDQIPTKDLIILWPDYNNHDIDAIVKNLNTNTLAIEDVLENSISVLKEKKSFVKLTQFEDIIRKNQPTFSHLNYGYGSLIEFLKTSTLISIREENGSYAVAYDLEYKANITEHRIEDINYQSIFIDICKKLAKTDGWVYFSQFALEIKRSYPAFNSVNFGYRRLTDMLKVLTDILEHRYSLDRTELFIRLIEPEVKSKINKKIIVDSKSVPTSLLIEAYEKSKDKEDWAYMGNMGSLLRKLYPGFNAKNYGFASMTELYESLSDIFEVSKEFNSKNSIDSVYVKQRSRIQSKTTNQLTKHQAALPLTTIKNAFINTPLLEDGWVMITDFYNQIQKIERFSPTDYGYNTFYDFVTNNKNLFDIKIDSLNEPLNTKLKLLFS